jgi:hypothetical protein
MSNGEPISITLSPAQVDQVVRAAAQGRTPSFSALISTTLDAQWLGREEGRSAPAEHAGEAPDGTATGYFPSYEDTRLSRSLMRGLSILTCFGPDNRERGIIELAGQLDMSPSTTHRYVATLVELGLLERSPRSRKYRLARVSDATPAPEAADAALSGESAGAPLAQPALDQ